MLTSFRIFTFTTAKILCSILLLINLTACVKVQNAALLIPKDVFFASRANILRATYQVPNWKDIMRQEFAIDMDSDTTVKAKFLASGRAYIFGELLKKQDNFIAFTVNIINRKNLEKFVRRMNPDMQIDTYKKYKFIVRNKSMLAWNSSVLLLLVARQADNEEKLKELFIRLVDNKKEDALINANDNFVDVLKNDHDMALWINTQKLGETKMLSQFAKNVNLQDNYLHVLADFDEGKVAANTTYFTHKSFYDAYKNLLSGSVCPSLLNNAPVQNPAVLIAFHLKREGIKQFLKDIEWTEKAENMINSITLSMDEFIEMMSGDALLMLKDISNLQKDLAQKDTLALKDKKLVSDLVLGVKIRNQVTCDSLMSILVKSGLMEKKENYYYFFNEIYVMQKDSLMYITRNESIKDDFFKGIVLDNQNLAKLAKDNWFLIHADEAIAEKTIDGKPTLLKDIARSLIKNEALKLESAIIHLANTNSKGKNEQSGQSLLVLKDKSANSLLAMLEMLKEIVFQTKLRIDPNFSNKEEIKD